MLMAYLVLPFLLHSELPPESFSCISLRVVGGLGLDYHVFLLHLLTDLIHAIYTHTHAHTYEHTHTHTHIGYQSKHLAGRLTIVRAIGDSVTATTTKMCPTYGSKLKR